jgi:hypothetical protein
VLPTCQSISRRFMRLQRTERARLVGETIPCVTTTTANTCQAIRRSRGRTDSLAEASITRGASPIGVCREETGTAAEKHSRGGTLIAERPPAVWEDRGADRASNDADVSRIRPLGAASSWATPVVPDATPGAVPIVSSRSPWGFCLGLRFSAAAEQRCQLIRSPKKLPITGNC